MEHLGTPYQLPDIADEDWYAGLKARFSELDLTINEEQIGRILDASARHPQTTMAICEEVRSFVTGGVDTEVTDLAVTNGIEAGGQR